ncbi:MAG: T9SS type A sorting domain-containing protein [Bacteroidia bacterium]|nr:T9SS type A sorting domain-containing protein [Bacteroidia bacterium]
MKALLPVLMLSLALPLHLFTQNLVPNPGFENYTTCPSGSCQWYYASAWSNVNGSLGCSSSNGSPDYFHTCGAQFFTFPTTLNGEVTPLGGDAVMGIATWLSFSSNFREYLAIALSSPLQAGKAYTLSFAYTNGDADPGASYGGYGTRLGVHFSVGPLTQTGASPIQLTPVYESSGPVYSTSWQTVNVAFVPTQNYTHLTIGNFRGDATTAPQLFSTPTGAGYAYYFLDDISVTEDVVLPVELLTWDAAPYPDGVRLTWETSPLTQATEFHIARSSDGLLFSDIASLMASSGDHTFGLRDNFPINGVTYYRLRYLTEDGREVLSSVRQVVRDTPPRLSLSPNPLDDTRVVSVYSDEAGATSVWVRIWNEQGQSCFETKRDITSSTQLDLRHLPPGLYLIEAASPQGRIRQKLILP